jgi:hypothetical protein
MGSDQDQRDCFTLFGVLLLELIWKMRNKVVHEGKKNSIEEMHRGLNRIFLEHWSVIKGKQPKEKAKHVSHWSRLYMSLCLFQSLTPRAVCAIYLGQPDTRLNVRACVNLTKQKVETEPKRKAHAPSIKFHTDMHPKNKEPIELHLHHTVHTI